MTQSPIENYQQALATGQFTPDPAQLNIMQHLQAIYEQWSQQHLKKNIFTALKQLLNITREAPVTGLYLWGGVGAGKTWLIDLFYDCLPVELKVRLHFHRFMRHIHQELTQLQGQQNPLKIVAQRFAKQVRLIFLDEFIVNDITDAMLLANLLDALFAAGITLMATSNVPPEGLYRNGLQRSRFLPAIVLLNQHLTIMQTSVQVDYRLRSLEQVGVYFYPLDERAERQLFLHYQHLAHDGGKEAQSIMIEGRSIMTRYCANEVIWFDFQVLCNVPRSQLDYVEIAQIYGTVILSNVPQILPEQHNLICYLINLVDIFYDSRVKLLVSAAVAVEQLYLQGRYSFEFKRTRSRLLEMQSQDYISQAHLP